MYMHAHIPLDSTRHNPRLVLSCRVEAQTRRNVSSLFQHGGHRSDGDRLYQLSMYRLMLLGRAAPVVNARLPLTEAMWSQRTVAEAEDRHRQHRHRIVCTPHAGGSGA